MYNFMFGKISVGSSLHFLCVCFRFLLKPVSGFCVAECFSLCLQHLHYYNFSFESIALSSTPASTVTVLRMNISRPQKRKGGEKGLQSSSLSSSPCHSCAQTDKDYMGQTTLRTFLLEKMNNHIMKFFFVFFLVEIDFLNFEKHIMNFIF